MNAICFRDRNGLCEALDRIDRLSVEEIQRIRANVIEYYERHLRGDQFLRELCDRNIERICMPFNKKNFFCDSGWKVANRAA